MVYQLVPVGVTVPLTDVDPPAAIDPRLVAVPHALPFEMHVPLHSVDVGEHVQVYPMHTPAVGGVHAVPAGCGMSGGHAGLDALHDWLVSHTPDAV